ncbi:hypothetical protein F5Y09DRAFT_306177 [Xylaria sp. FL1042]|nr:hypothetical protein F5Y09DRAFT_306177 [Xylaria sp. FL1042]
MKPALKRHRAEESDGDSDESHSSDVHATDHQDLDQGGIDLSGHGIINSNSRLEIGRDFRVVRVENNFISPAASWDTTAHTKWTITKAEQLEKAFNRLRRSNLSSLTFPHIGRRETIVGDAHVATCQWFLRKPIFLNWLDESQFSTHNGLLWIKGKPGAGKSTLMKYVLSQIRQDNKWKLVISFFFYGRGEKLERSTVGLYRSLLTQLFNARPHLEKLLESLPTGHQWTVGSLESLFRAAVRALEDPTLICFIDALDECEESQIRRMLLFLMSLSPQTNSNPNTRLLICCASRPYPNITLKKGLVFHLEDQDDHQGDIFRYIDGILNIGSTDLAMEIRSDLRKSASGVFMWVVLVVDILNREYDRGRPDRLRQMLQDIPKDLHDLFHSILTRDEDNPDGLLCCIQWILFSTRPLSPQEHYFATLSGLEPRSIPACHLDVSIEDMTRYILNISKGLAEIVGAKSPIVRFIHDSVRDFLLNQNGVERIRQDLGSNVQGYSHEKLRSCCAEYIMSIPVREVFRQGTTQDGVAMGETTRPLPKEIMLKFPFLEYATKHILHHAEEAERHAISQSHFLSTFPREMWIQQANISKNTYRQYNPNTSLMYILAEMKLPALIRAHVTSQSCFAVEGPYGAPILAALATGSNETVQALLEVQARRLADHRDMSLIRDLLTEEVNARRFSQSFLPLRGRSIAISLAQCGSRAVFELFLATEAVDLDFKDINGETALSWAARSGHEALVELLLKKGAGIDIQDTASRTPLSWATGYGEVAVVRLLLKRGADVNSRDKSGWGPLSWAVAGFHKATVRSLLASNANTNLRDNEDRSPLFLAVTNGDLDSCEMLIDHDADINARDNVGRTPLSWAVGFNQKEVTLLLLEKGARTDVQAYIGGTLWSWAWAHRYTTLGRLLLRRIPQEPVS